MSVFQSPPTWALPVLVDETSGKAVFNPVWLKWFVDLSANLSNSSGGGGATLTHNSLNGLQGGTASQYYHLTAAEYAALGIKTVQYGTITITAGNTSSTATITAVGAKAILLPLGSSTNALTPDQGSGKLTLTNSTTVTGDRNNSGGQLDMNFVVIDPM